MAGAPDLLDVGVDIVGKAAGRIAFTGAEVEGFIGSVALFEPLAIWSIKVGDAVAIGGNQGRAIIRIIGDGAVRRAQRGANGLVAIGIIGKTPVPDRLNGMGLDRGRALGGIDIGAQARVRSQVAGKVVGKGLAERGGVGIGSAQQPVEIVIGIGPAVLGPVPGHGDDAAGMVPGIGQRLDDGGALGGEHRVEPVAGGTVRISGRYSIGIGNRRSGPEAQQELIRMHGD